MEFIAECPHCGSTFTFTSSEVEEILYSDPHDPDRDYIRCPECEGLIDITDEDLEVGFPVGIVHDVTIEWDGYLMSDTVNVYLRRGSEVIHLQEVDCSGIK